MTAPRRRLHMMVDLAGYSSLIGPMQAQRQTDVLSLLEAARAAAGLDPGSWYRQATGDGLFAVLPEGTDTGRVVVDFTRELDTALRGYNDSLGAELRLQLRVALAAGAIQITEHGWVGQAVITVARLVDALEVREALAAALPHEHGCRNRPEPLRRPDNEPSARVPGRRLGADPAADITGDPGELTRPTASCPRRSSRAAKSSC